MHTNPFSDEFSLRADVMKEHDILVIGAGSIGRRHAVNLSDLGASVSIYDVNPVALDEFCRDSRFLAVYNLENALENNYYTAALVCTPNHLHIPCAQKVADAGIHLFIEKPLSHSLEGVDHLLKTVETKGLLTMAGFNLRYEPGLRFIKNHIVPENVAFALIEFGSYMPGWRPGTDYRKIYSANKSMGGGIILDDVHELDYACWLFGYPDSVVSSSGTFSPLEIDVEDVADIQMKYFDKLVTIHMDYLQRQYTRRCKIVMKDGYSIEWVYGDHATLCYKSGEQSIQYKDSFSPNDMYKDEMWEFLSCLETGKAPESDLSNAVTILKIAMEAKQELM
jgi:predicted dehydrogenase